jgi:hypothetical protein
MVPDYLNRFDDYGAGYMREKFGFDSWRRQEAFLFFKRLDLSNVI